MDALFGLARKKSAGQSHRDPLHGHVFFKNQVSVDEHVASAPQRRVYDKVCSDFLAGDALRSSNRYKALDETALFGCGCRHEFPLMFKHGERYYTVKIVVCPTHQMRCTPMVCLHTQPLQVCTAHHWSSVISHQSKEGVLCTLHEVFRLPCMCIRCAGSQSLLEKYM